MGSLFLGGPSGWYQHQVPLLVFVFFEQILFVCSCYVCPMRALVYLATPTAAAAWTWINGHHYASASTARVTAAHRPRSSRLASSHPAAAIASGLHGGGGGHHAEEQLLALGRRLAQDGDLESAVLQFERAAGQAPRSAVCKVELGRALVRVGRSDEGFNCLVDAFGIDSLCPGVKEGFLEYYRAEIEVSVVGLFFLHMKISGSSNQCEYHTTVTKLVKGI